MTTALAAAPAVRFLADSDADKASPVGLFVVFALLVGCFFLFRSMSKHLRKVPATFDSDAAADEPGAQDGEADVVVETVEPIEDDADVVGQGQDDSVLLEDDRPRSGTRSSPTTRPS